MKIQIWRSVVIKDHKGYYRQGVRRVVFNTKKEEWLHNKKFNIMDPREWWIYLRFVHKDKKGNNLPVRTSDGEPFMYGVHIYGDARFDVLIRNVSPNLHATFFGLFPGYYPDVPENRDEKYRLRRREMEVYGRLDKPNLPGMKELLYREGQK